MSEETHNQSQHDIKVIDIQSLDYIRELGKGSEGTVVLYSNKTNRKVYAVKQYKFRSNAEKESSFLRGLQEHENIIRFHGLFDYNKLCLDYCIEGDLFDKQMSLPHLTFNSKQALSYIYDISKGVAFIHSRNFIHCDIKPENCLIGMDGRIKIADFGHSKKFNQQLNPFMRSYGGTLRYSAPEVVNRQIVNFKIDCWSIGVCLYLFITGALPFNIYNKDNYTDNIETKKAIKSGNFSEVVIIKKDLDEISLFILNNLIMLINKLLVVKVDTRLSSSDIIDFIEREIIIKL